MIDDSMKLAYGAYDMPQEIKDLLQLEEDLTRKGLSMEIIGIRPVHSYYSYSITPPDLIPFADTGGDGIHFGFLTEFGQIENLNSAPIVCVTPTNDPPIRLLARTIREFLDLASSVPYIELLEQWSTCGDEASLLEEQKQLEEDTPIELRNKRKEIFARLQDRFGTRQKNVHSYIQEVLQEREGKLALPTMDRLGVIGTRNNLQRYEFDFSHTLEEKELERMKSFLSTACEEEKLAFIRDANYRYIVDEDYAVAELLRELMSTLGLQDEIIRKFEL